MATAPVKQHSGAEMQKRCQSPCSTPEPALLRPPSAPRGAPSVSAYSSCSPLEGQRLRAAIISTIEAVAAANECFLDDLPEEGTHMCHFHCSTQPGFTFTVYAKALSHIGRDDCWPMAFILTDRISKRSGTALCAGNVHRLLFTAFVIAVKVRIDCRRFSATASKHGRVSLADLNAMERAFLQAIDWDVHVTAQQYEEVVDNFSHYEVAAERWAALSVPGERHAFHVPLIPERSSITPSPAGLRCPSRPGSRCSSPRPSCAEQDSRPSHSTQDSWVEGLQASPSEMSSRGSQATSRKSSASPAAHAPPSQVATHGGGTAPRASHSSSVGARKRIEHARQYSRRSSGTTSQRRSTGGSTGRSRSAAREQP
eukprot:TRINITY_DN11288_c0_g1_i1.p1 TRINITY_DN11288_c0_g1~~TRINITY_DN11288_c0_g1_i1.p1  ORF type:complete len:369 (+),score=47.16 TRINITY_DN11288_c0_g1_i1:77-1183(+)